MRSQLQIIIAVVLLTAMGISVGLLLLDLWPVPMIRAFMIREIGRADGRLLLSFTFAVICSPILGVLLLALMVKKLGQLAGG